MHQVQIRRRWAEEGTAVLVSFVVHLVLLLVLALWAYTKGAQSRTLRLTADLQPSTTQLLELSANQEAELPETTDTVMSTPEVEFRIDLPLASPISESPSAPPTVDLATFASTAAAVVEPRPQTQPKGRGALFFGAYAEGDRFVYVLDSSHSMEGERWRYACQQLLYSLGGLRDDQEFFVVCFDEVTTLLFNSTPQTAHYYNPTSENLDRVRQWLRSRRLGHETKPAEAMQYALLCQPDAVFMLSDGELQDNTIAMLRQLNPMMAQPKQIPIHTIHLFSKAGRQTLQLIARENGGSFTPIDN
ncbi:MAG: VWA domain-containing protein [Planctomycetales bacterium]|nr:VWA domain-containing protein [Planctomycetales bacterium]